VAALRQAQGPWFLRLAKKARGTTEQGEYRSHARMAMIEPISWDLIEEKVQPSPTYPYVGLDP